MKKRRYSEEFYAEIDTLIKVHTEKSSKKFEVLEITPVDEKNPPKSKYGYVPPPSFLTVAKKNYLLRYIVIFFAILIVTLLGSTAISGNLEQNKKIEEQKALVARKDKGDDQSARKKSVKFSSYHQRLDVAVKPAPTTWNNVEQGKLKPYVDQKEQVKSVPDEPFVPERTGVEKPDIVEQNEKMLKGEVIPFSANAGTPVSNVKASLPGIKESGETVRSEGVIPPDENTTMPDKAPDEGPLQDATIK